MSIITQYYPSYIYPLLDQRDMTILYCHLQLRGDKCKKPEIAKAVDILVLSLSLSLRHRIRPRLRLSTSASSSAKPRVRLKLRCILSFEDIHCFCRKGEVLTSFQG